MMGLRQEALWHFQWEFIEFSHIWSHSANHSEEKLSADVLWATTDTLFSRNVSIDSSMSIYKQCILEVNMNNKLVGIFYFLSVAAPSHWLLGKILCIEDSGGSSALMFTQSTGARPVITKLWCQIIKASWDLKLRITAYSLFPLWVHGAKSLWVGRQPIHCGNKRCKVSSVTYWFPAFPSAFSFSLLAAHLYTKALLLLLDSSLVNSL